MERVNTVTNVDYFFKAFMWKLEPFELKGYVVTNKNQVLIYRSNDSTINPVVVESIGLTNKQVKAIKKYLFSCKDFNKSYTGYVNEKDCLVKPDYVVITDANNFMKVKGYFYNKFAERTFKGDMSIFRIVSAIEKIADDVSLTKSDYIEIPKGSY